MSNKIIGFEGGTHMMSSSEDQCRFKLKKYRGILMGELLDLMNVHEEEESDHEIGEGQQCLFCKRYNQLRVDLDKVNQLLKNTKRPAVDREKVTQIKRHFYYVCTDQYNNSYVLRARNKGEASDLLRATQEGRTTNDLQHISRREAFQIIESFEGADAKRTLDYLQRDDYYLGVVSQHEAEATQVRA